MDVIRINLGFSYVAPIIRGPKWLKTGLEAQNGSYVAPIISEIGTPKKSLFRLRRAPTPFFPVFLCGADPFGLGTLKNPQKPPKMTCKHQVFDDFWKIAKNPYVAPIPFFQKTRKSAFFAFFRLFGVFSAFLHFF